MMGADVRIIRLVRKIIRQQTGAAAGENEEQDYFFATDYFDVMKVEKKELSSPFTAIMGIWPDEKMDILDVAAKSYSLYCSSKMMESEKGKKECADPFEPENSQMPFLSMIQVHITPEVMAHSLPEKSAGEIMDAIYEDIHTAVLKFSNSCKKECMIFRIYKMLSAGDYALVLRSNKAETSFRVSSMLRQRFINGSDGKRLVLYKTYTLLTLDKSIIRHEMERRKDSHGMPETEMHQNACFVLRCCYSNLYWSNKEKIEEYLKKENIYTTIRLHGLNGRYDFSVRVTEQQFLALLEDIKKYKETGSLDADPMPGEDGIVKYIKYLMKNHYLSYINERYLVAQERCKERHNMFCGAGLSGMIHTTAAGLNEEYLENKINEIYEDTADKCRKVRYKVDKIEYYRKNMKHYMDLIDKLIKLCYGINGFSDTRIYAAVLLEQLDVIIESIEIYIEMYQGTDDKEGILCSLEEYIRESVCALDKYAQYIRNNNLQSLQTPNYNIESNMSMEKLLIGYSEFLKVFTEFYQRKKMDLVNKEDQCNYIPIVVPALSKGDVSVETLFPKGLMGDWNKERKIRSGKRDQHCMVISVPTLTELGNVRTMVTSLFHEVAHQFRYESRKERNDTLLKYLVRTMMRDIRNEWVLRFQNDTGIIERKDLFERCLDRSLADAYLETNYGMDESGKLEYSFREAPLNSFLECLESDIRDVFRYWGKKNNIKSVLHVFLKGLMDYYRPDQSQCQDAIEILNQVLGQDESGNYEMESEQAVKCAYGIAWECACQSIGSSDRIWKAGKFRAWVEKEEELEFQKEWEKAFGKIKEEKKRDEVQKIWKIFTGFSEWIYDECGNVEATKNYSIKKRTEFLKRAYQNISEAWSGKEIQDCLKEDFDSSLSCMGRALGVDHRTEENYRIFEREITFVIIQKYDVMVEMIKWRSSKYREETADMFMCNAMKLTPFGYMYLLAVSWPNDQEISVEYCSRSQNILLFQWCLDEKNALSHKKFRELCAGMIGTLEEVVDRAVKRIVSANGQEVVRAKDKGPAIWDSEEQMIEIVDRVKRLADYCADINARGLAQEDPIIREEYDLLKFYGIMAHMMEEIILWSAEKIDYFNDFEELRKDYVRGIEHLKNMNEEMCRDKDPLVRRLGGFCDEISVMQNEPYLLMENAEMKEKLNEYSIEFLLDMYCVNKCQVAQRIGGGLCRF